MRTCYTSYMYIAYSTWLVLSKIDWKCDEAEGLVPPSMWSLGTYKELLFLDSGKFK